ncbi:MAG: hypothetical protein KOO60_13490 [Gemmatimonadales bacterium]|nr:hypothetical protein [Gemmatimonadales bacterium]
MNFTRVARLPQIVVPLLVTVLYSLSFSHLLSWLLQGDVANVNAVFVDNLWKLLLLAAAGLYLLFFVFFKIQKNRTFAFENSVKKLNGSDCLFILLPLTPVVQYVLNNQDILSVLSSFRVIGFFAAFSVVLIVVIPALLSVVSSGRILMFIGMAFSFTITNMASLTAHSKWFERGDLVIQLGLLISIFVVGLLLYNHVGKKLTRAIIVLYFVANSINSLPFITERGKDFAPIPIDNKMVELVGERMPLTTPDIFFLIYDAYVPNETMLGYGIDNSAQEGYLTGAGFQLYPQTYSISANTVGTISRVFSVSRSFYGEPRTAASGDGAVQRLLQSFGYKTYGIFWSDYLFQNGCSHYDYSFPDLIDPQWLFVKAVLINGRIPLRI